jgi:hypothetical protein
MLPLPGANFVYSFGKDVWRWGSSRWRGRNLLRAEVFRRWTVDQWYEPFAAIREFADQELLGRSDNADEEHRKLWEELPSGEGMTPEEYKNARDQADSASVRVRALRALQR